MGRYNATIKRSDMSSRPAVLCRCHALYMVIIRIVSQTEWSVQSQKNPGWRWSTPRLPCSFGMKQSIPQSSSIKDPVFLSCQAGPALHRPGHAALSGSFQMRARPAGFSSRASRHFHGGWAADLHDFSWRPGGPSAGLLLTAGRPICRPRMGSRPEGFICQCISSIKQA